MNDRIRSLFPFFSFFLPWGVYFSILWPRILEWRQEGLFAGHPYVWADWSMHIALASNFAYRPVEHWFDSLPVFSGAPVTYPFVTNLISGLLMRIGTSIPFAFLIPSLFFTLLTLVLLFRFYSFVFRSTVLGSIAPTLFLCSGGIGAFLIAKELGISAWGDSTMVLTQIPQYQIEVNNIVSSMLIPQRAFLLGLPIGLVLFQFLIAQFLTLPTPDREIRKLIFMGTLAGLLPIIHTHTFIVIVLFCGWLSLQTLSSWKKWIWFSVPAAITSLILYAVFLHKGVSVSTFFSFQPGWLESDGIGEWLTFWWRNWGVFILLAIGGTIGLGLKKRTTLFRFSLFFWCMFILGNLVLFQPQSWDNTKIFAWVYLGLTIPALFLLQLLFYFRKWGRVLAVGIAIAAGLSGAIDILHNLDSNAKTFQMLSKDEIELGESIRSLTSPNIVMLTPATVPNPISMIGGRSVVLGYPGWAFSYGLPYSIREADIKRAYLSSQSLIQVASIYKAWYVYVPLSDQASIEANNRLELVTGNPAGAIYRIN